MYHVFLLAANQSAAFAGTESNKDFSVSLQTHASVSHCRRRGIDWRRYRAWPTPTKPSKRSKWMTEVHSCSLAPHVLPASPTSDRCWFCRIWALFP